MAVTSPLLRGHSKATRCQPLPSPSGVTTHTRLNGSQTAVPLIPRLRCHLKKGVHTFPKCCVHFAEFPTRVLSSAPDFLIYLACVERRYLTYSRHLLRPLIRKKHCQPEAPGTIWICHPCGICSLALPAFSRSVHSCNCHRNSKGNTDSPHDHDLSFRALGLPGETLLPRNPFLAGRDSPLFVAIASKPVSPRGYPLISQWNALCRFARGRRRLRSLV